MNITEHEMRGLLAGKCLPGDMRVNEELPAYLVRKFAELKAERDALATELSAVEVIHDECAFVTDDDYEACPEKVQKIIRNLAVMQIPATDAYLNSVRADAVVEAAAHLGDMAAGKSASTAELIKSCGRALLAFAAQLRAGEPS